MYIFEVVLRQFKAVVPYLGTEDSLELVLCRVLETTRFRETAVP